MEFSLESRGFLCRAVSEERAAQLAVALLKENVFWMCSANIIEFLDKRLFSWPPMMRAVRAVLDTDRNAKANFLAPRPGVRGA